jgi:aminopeptidase N
VGAITAHFGDIHDTIAASPDHAAFEKWVRNFLRPIANDLGDTSVPGEADEKRALRADVFATLGTYGRDPQLLQSSRALVDKYMRDPSSVEAALARQALSLSALEGNADLYEKYLEHMKTAKTPEEYYSYFRALGQFTNADLVKRTFEFALSPDVKNQDLYIIGRPLNNPDTAPIAWELVKTNYDVINSKAGASLGGGLVQFAGSFCDEKLRDDAQDFFTSKNIPGAERELQNAKDQVNACISLRAQQQANLSAYLKKQPAK